MSNLPHFTWSLFDDAAVFPPGSASLAVAVPAHMRHTAAPYAASVGPLVLPASAMAELAELLTPSDQLDVAVTLPQGSDQLAEVVRATAALPIRLRALEIAVPEHQTVGEFFTALRGARPERTEIFVEVPRDSRRAEIISGCARHGYRAKFRTGGMRAELYPDDAELAEAILAVVAAEVSFKATAGLHHAVRNTDPRTGFEQHGFLNLLLATGVAAHQEADVGQLHAVLAERDVRVVVERMTALTHDQVSAIRDRFMSFGTCSISEPLTELVELGLVPGSVLNGKGATS